MSDVNDMIKFQLLSRGIEDKNVLEAMRKVPRDKFVSDRQKDQAYLDSPLPIDEGQTISQPYIVAYMTEMAGIDKNSRVLEIGTGSGYQSAVLSEIVKDVYTVEIIKSLGEKAKELFEDLEYKNIHCKISDGYYGWPEEGPYDAIIVTAAPNGVPEPLLSQLKIGGRLIIPVGSIIQELVKIVRTEDGFERDSLIGVRFVPFTGKASKVF